MNLGARHDADSLIFRDRPASGKHRLELRLVRTLAELEPVAEAWNRLALASPDRMPMPSHAWVASYFEHQLAPGESWFCLLAFDGKTLVGVLPAIAVAVRRLGLPHLDLRAPNNNHTRSVDILAEPGREKEIMTALVAGLSRLHPSVFSLRVRHLPEPSASLAVFKDGVPGASAVCDFNEYGSFIPITGTFEDFTGRLTTKFARNLRRLGRKIDELRDVKISFLAGKDATDQELDRFLKVEAANWKSREGSAITLSPQLVGFYTAMVRRIAAAGWLEWHFLDADGKTIAGHLAIRVGRALVVLKIGFDEAYSSYSPGNILFESMIKRAYTAGDTDEINCLTYYPWNINWAMSLRSHYDLRIFLRRPVPLLAGLGPIAARQMAGRVPGVRPVYEWWKARRTAAGDGQVSHNPSESSSHQETAD